MSDGHAKRLDAVSLHERMQEGQDAIYYALGQNKELLDGSPHLEVLKKKSAWQELVLLVFEWVPTMLMISLVSRVVLFV